MLQSPSAPSSPGSFFNTSLSSDEESSDASDTPTNTDPLIVQTRWVCSYCGRVSHHKMRHCCLYDEYTGYANLLGPFPIRVTAVVVEACYCNEQHQALHWAAHRRKCRHRKRMRRDRFVTDTQIDINWKS